MKWTHDTQPEAAAVQLAVFRRMGPQRRLEATLEMSDEGRELAADGVRHRHPEYGDAEVQDAVRLLMWGEQLYREVWPGRPLPSL